VSLCYNHNHKQPGRIKHREEKAWQRLGKNKADVLIDCNKRLDASRHWHAACCSGREKRGRTTHLGRRFKVCEPCTAKKKKKSCAAEKNPFLKSGGRIFQIFGFFPLGGSGKKPFLGLALFLLGLTQVLTNNNSPFLPPPPLPP